MLRFLEHVISPIHVTAGRKRGDLRVYLQSPSGTRSTLLHNRPQDFSGKHKIKIFTVKKYFQIFI